MTDLAQKIADAVCGLFSVGPSLRIELEAAIRTALPVAQGEAVATVTGRLGDQLRVGWIRPELCDVGSMLYAAPPASTPEAQGEAGEWFDPSDVPTLFHAPPASRIAELEREVERLRGFVETVSKQTPEQPDYWSSCGQCSHNISDAEDIIEALAAQEKNDE